MATAKSLGLKLTYFILIVTPRNFYSDEIHKLVEKAFVCVSVNITELKIKVNTYYQYLLYIFTIMNLSSGVLHIIHHSSVQGESTPNLLW